jgi:phage virion morphogenesis protein
MAIITIELQGLERARARLNVVATGQLKRTVLEMAGVVVEGQTKRRIVAGKQSPDGQGWAPLAASTVKRKGTDNILVDTGRLLGSISHIVSGDQAIIGTNVAYAGHLQHGTRKMPARPFLGLSDGDVSELERVIAAAVRGLIR